MILFARIACNPKGRGLLHRGFVGGLARSPCYAASPTSCPRRKIFPVHAVLAKRIMLQ